MTDEDKQIYEEVPSLEEFLEEHKGQIDYVMLTYKWGPYVAVIETDSYFVDKRGNIHNLYRFAMYDMIDEEYCCFGSYEEALEFSKNYNVWDGLTLTLDGTILTADHIAYDYYFDDDQPNSVEELARSTSINIRLKDLVYYSPRGKLHSYIASQDGPIYRRKDCCHIDGLDCYRGESCEDCPRMKEEYPEASEDPTHDIPS